MNIKQVVLFINVMLLAVNVLGQKTRITRPGMPPLAKDALVVLFEQKDNDFPTESAIEIGVLYSVDYLPPGKSTPQQLFDVMRQHARDNGANALKIVEIKTPKLSTDWDKVVATMYKVDSISKYERYFFWSKDRKLSWEDFKGTPPVDSVTTPGVFAACGFNFKAERVYTTQKAHVYLINAFLCRQSWALADSMQVKHALAYQQLRFDIGEVYTRQCRERFTRAGFDEVKSTDLALKAYHKVFLDYLDEMEVFNTDTDYGRNEERLLNWRNKIDQQLLLLQEFSSH